MVYSVNFLFSEIRNTNDFFGICVWISLNMVDYHKPYFLYYKPYRVVYFTNG